MNGEALAGVHGDSHTSVHDGAASECAATRSSGQPGGWLMVPMFPGERLARMNATANQTRGCRRGKARVNAFLDGSTSADPLLRIAPGPRVPSQPSAGPAHLLTDAPSSVMVGPLSAPRTARSGPAWFAGVAPAARGSAPAPRGRNKGRDAMNWQTWTIIWYFAANAVGTVIPVGRPHLPVTPVAAAICLFIYAGLIAVAVTGATP